MYIPITSFVSPFFFRSFHENRSPFRLLNTSLASYLLFSPSFSGACLVAAGSLFACTLGLVVSSSLLIWPASAPLSPALRGGAAVFALTTALGLTVGLELVAFEVGEPPCRPCACSSWNWRARFWRSASALAARSALMDFFAK